MSLFGFVKDIGNRVFNRDEDAAEKIKEMIETSNPGVKDLTVDFGGGGVVLCGECESAEAREKVILMAGNTQGVIDVNAKGLTYPKPEPGTPEAKAEEEVLAKTEYYVIKSGDTLGKVAKQFYGDAMQYPKIFEANREVIQDPNKIFPGQKIRIPPAD